MLTLLTLPAGPRPTRQALGRFPRDSDAAVELTPDALEMRDDVAMTDPRVREIIYVLATPELEGQPKAVQVRAFRSALGRVDPH